MRVFVFAAVIVSSFSFGAFGQDTNQTPAKTRPRVVVVGATPVPSPTQPRIVVIPNPTPGTVQSPVGPTAVTPSTNLVPALLSLSQIKQKLAEAKREMTARPLTIAMTDGVSPASPLEIVRLAFFDVATKQLDFVSLTKDAFLTKGADYVLSSQALKMIRFRVIRPNGVNTPVTITDLEGRQHIPLMVQYPVVRNGIYYETAYYMSTHPGLVTAEVVNAGKLYVRNTIDAAREKLRQNGIAISPKAADIAERLSIVEHVDHYRFRTEHHPNIYNDVFTLYALNEGQTYRYSVSSAGAGGMVQMIPSTYRMIRARFPSVPLMPDFVAGMQNHGNAAQAMLLYIQSTYDDLLRSPAITDALSNGLATDFELLSAGYNSNPAKLPGYIKRGGVSWRGLIPRETKIYLQINASLERHVPFAPRGR
jgi:hypothetical protein